MSKEGVLPKVSQEVSPKWWAGCRLGFVDDNSGGAKVRHALLSVVLHDAPVSDR